MNNKFELNRLYSEIRGKLESLMQEFKITPSELNNYVRNNLDELVEEFGMVDSIFSKTVILDVCSHYENSFKDGLMTFESFVKNLKFM